MGPWAFRIAAAASTLAYASAQGLILTVAGTGYAFRDGSLPAVQAPVGPVRGVAAGLNGDVYFTDIRNNLVLKVDAQGILTIVAGNSFDGFSGDGGAATSARLSYPDAVAIDRDGSLYIADKSNRRVRKVSPDGIVSTLAGDGSNRSSGDGGPATAAGLVAPSGVAIDSARNVYISDHDDNRVRKVSSSGIITTVAGNGQRGAGGDGGPATGATLDGPEGIAVDSAGNLYIVVNRLVRKVSPDGIITTFAGNGRFGSSGDGGPAVNASLDVPYGVAVDAANNVYIAEFFGTRVRKVSPDGIITTFAGTGDSGFSGDGGPAPAAELSDPSDVAADSLGNLYIADTRNARVRRVSADGTIATLAGNGKIIAPGDGGFATSAAFADPVGLAVDAAGGLLVSDYLDSRVRRIAPDQSIATAAGGEFGLSRDGEPAVGAKLIGPQGIAADNRGSFYFVDGHRIRKVTPDGVIATVAGNGQQGASGDGGPALQATFREPHSVAVDAAGNLFISDTENNRVRKVDMNGVISTLAQVNQPQGLAIDSAGNVFAADWESDLVYKITPSGQVSTAAGNGSTGFSGDGGPATRAQLYTPIGLAFDAAGNLYIADSENNRVRRVAPDGVISTIAGNGERGFSGDGGPATSASLRNPVAVAVDRNGQVFIADEVNRRIRVVVPSRPSFDVTPASLDFAGGAGGAESGAKTLEVTSAFRGLAFSATASAPWLRITASAGQTSSALQVTADPGALQPGVNTATITIAAPDATPNVRTVTVRFTVGPSTSARAAAKPSSLSFAFRQGALPQVQALAVSNEGSGSLALTPAVSTITGGSWLSISPAGATATVSEPASFAVSANPAGLAPGAYRGAIAMGPLTAGVTMTVTAAPRTILLSQSGLAFTAAAGGGAPLPQTFGVLNTGQGAMNWTAKVESLSGSRSWLSLSSLSGSTDAASLNVPLVEASVDTTGLSPGDYYGQVRVDSPQADNSPQFVSVALSVLPPGSDPGPAVRPTGLIFAGVQDGPAPSSQDFLVSNLGASPTAYVSRAVTFDRRDWFSVGPEAATVTPGRAGRVTVQPETKDLPAGVRRDALTLLFSDGKIRNVSVVLLVVPGSGARSAARLADGCAATELIPVFTSLTADFLAPARWPAPVELRIIDNCGTPMTSGTVVASFSNGDPPVALSRLGDGRWSGTWQARNSAAGAVTVTVNAEIPEFRIRGAVSLTGSLRSNDSAPVIQPGRIVSAASLASETPLAPGSLISIFGSGLAATAGRSELLPLPSELRGAQGLIAGIPLPLSSVSPERIDAMIPYDLPVNTRHQILLRNGNALGVPETVTLAAAQPAIFTKDQSGAGQGTILAANGRLAEPGNAAAAGERIVISCAGLGQVSLPVAAGSASPENATAVNRVTVTIGGVNAPVSFAGLTSGAAGVYQVVARVPPGAQAGDRVEVRLTVVGQTSPPVTMAVR